MKDNLTKDEKKSNREQQNMDKYWQQCQYFDFYSLAYFIDVTSSEKKALKLLAS